MEDGSGTVDVCVHERAKGRTQGTCPAGTNLLEGLRFPRNRSLLPLSYAKSPSVLLLNNSRGYQIETQNTENAQSGF